MTNITSSTPTRTDAWKLLTEFVDAESLRRHSLSVEAAMCAHAKKFGEDEETWGMTGLLHDFDYEKYPSEHPFKGSQILRERGYPEDIITAILGHAVYSGVPRETRMAKTLFAVDELCGMVMATAHIRPAHFEGLSVQSVKKNLKKKGFAAAINRHEINQGTRELGVEEEEHIQTVIDALSYIKVELGF